MKRPLHEMIRRYSQAVDDTAPPIEELLPPEMAGRLGVDQTDLRITTRISPVKQGVRVPGWAIALAVAAVILLVSIPLLLLSDNEAPVANTTPPTTVSPPTTPAATGSPSLEFDRSTRRLSGTFWDPGATVTATLGDIERAATVDADGSFTTSEADFVRCCFDELVVTDGKTILRIADVPDMEVTRVDPVRDVIAGFSWDGQDVELTITGGGQTYMTTVSPQDNTWIADLSGEFDLIPGMVVEGRARFPEISVTHTTSEGIPPGLNLGLTANEIRADGFLPQSRVAATIDGADIDVLTDAAGRFTLNLDNYGMELAPGTTAIITDGVSTIESEAPLLTFDVLDLGAGVGSGNTDMTEGTELYLELWMSNDGSDEPNEYWTTSLQVIDGQWAVSFPPLPSGWRVVAAAIGGELDPGFGVETLFEPA